VAAGAGRLSTIRLAESHRSGEDDRGPGYEGIQLDAPISGKNPQPFAAGRTSRRPAQWRRPRCALWATSRHRPGRRRRSRAATGPGATEPAMPCKTTHSADARLPSESAQARGNSGNDLEAPLLRPRQRRNEPLMVERPEGLLGRGRWRQAGDPETLARSPRASGRPGASDQQRRQPRGTRMTTTGRENGGFELIILAQPAAPASDGMARGAVNQDAARPSAGSAPCPPSRRRRTSGHRGDAEVRECRRRRQRRRGGRHGKRRPASDPIRAKAQQRHCPPQAAAPQGTATISTTTETPQHAAAAAVGSRSAADGRGGRRQPGWHTRISVALKGL